ncbi:MAG TPA: 50S ribosomal protein L23 [candidate division Zixibacteria bacterium]|nr:50S ribosomal protein L23 [candidate division Zixibacteria bacterium]
MIKNALQLHLTTEKSAVMKEAEGKYVFRVERHATKFDIKSAVESAFKVKVKDVRTMIMPGKSKRMRFKMGKTPRWKKAIVKLEEGQVISDFENI